MCTKQKTDRYSLAGTLVDRQCLHNAEALPILGLIDFVTSVVCAAVASDKEGTSCDENRPLQARESGQSCNLLQSHQTVCEFLMQVAFADAKAYTLQCRSASSIPAINDGQHLAAGMSCMSGFAVLKQALPHVYCVVLVSCFLCYCQIQGGIGATPAQIANLLCKQPQTGARDMPVSEQHPPLSSLSSLNSI